MSTPTVVGNVLAKIAMLTTELNSLANNALVISSVNGTSGVFSNISGDAVGKGYIYGRLHLHLAAFGSAPTANTAIDGWFLNAADGAGGYESGSASITPARIPDFTFPVIAQTAAQDVEQFVVMPIGATFKVLTRNNTTGQSLASSGNTIDWYPTTSLIPSL